MRIVIALSVLAAADASQYAHADAGKLRPVHLAVDDGGALAGDEDDGGHGKAQRSSRGAMKKRSNASEGSHHPEAAGSLTCMLWTGGTCKLFSCKSERGFVGCQNDYCMCKPGTCADATGECKPNFEGKWIGEYSIRFSKPGNPDRPYLGTDGGGGAGEVPDGLALLSAVATSDRLWKVAQTPSGRVRLASTVFPDSVLIIYNNRRRRSGFLQTKAHDRRNASHKLLASLKDDDDLWPALVKFASVTPLEATFQVRPTLQNGGGHELWDPENEVALANADPESWGDSVVSQGITECYMESTFSSDPCEGGKQLIDFEPPLPNAARMAIVRAHIKAISILTWWQWAVIVGGICCCAVCFASDENNPNSTPLIATVAARAMEGVAAHREAAAEGQRVQHTFAESIAGLWMLETGTDMGNFEYEFGVTASGVSVHGRKEGDANWDTAFQGSVDATQLRWKDDNGTQFQLTFTDDTCSGAAKAADGQELPFTGKRTGPRPGPATESVAADGPATEPIVADGQ